MNILKLWTTKKAKPETYRINGNIIAVEPLNFSQLIDVIFLAAPLIKNIKKIKAEYQSDNPIEIFRFVVEQLVSEMDRNDIYKIFSLFLHVSEEDIKSASVAEMALVITKIIRRNNLFDLYLLFKRLGMFDG